MRPGRRPHPLPAAARRAGRGLPRRARLRPAQRPGRRGHRRRGDQHAAGHPREAGPGSDRARPASRLRQALHPGRGQRPGPGRRGRTVRRSAHRLPEPALGRGFPHGPRAGRVGRAGRGDRFRVADGAVPAARRVLRHRRRGAARFRQPRGRPGPAAVRPGRGGVRRGPRAAGGRLRRPVLPLRQARRRGHLAPARRLDAARRPRAEVPGNRPHRHLRRRVRRRPVRAAARRAGRRCPARSALFRSALFPRPAGAGSTAARTSRRSPSRPRRAAGAASTPPSPAPCAAPARCRWTRGTPWPRSRSWTPPGSAPPAAKRCG